MSFILLIFARLRVSPPLPSPLPFPHSLCLLVCVCVCMCDLYAAHANGNLLLGKFSTHFQDLANLCMAGKQSHWQTDGQTKRHTYGQLACNRLALFDSRIEIEEQPGQLIVLVDDSMNVTSQWMWPEMLIETGRGRYIAQYICITYNIIVILYVCECIN